MAYLAAQLNLGDPLIEANDSPRRIQRQRARGWRKPKGCICVTRGTPWGNPFVVKPDAPTGTELGKRSFIGPDGAIWTQPFIAVPTAEDAVSIYRVWLDDNPHIVEKARRNLKGKDLACWCALDQTCHADVLLEIVNK